jgi:hypothetical protein
MEKRAAREAILSSAFFLYVYHNENATMDAVVSYLANYESNPGLKAMATDPKGLAELTAVFAQMEFIASDPRVAVWFCFFHDLWKSNNKMNKIKPKADLLDPANTNAICWHVMAPEDLDKVLKTAGLRKSGSLFSDATFKTLYDLMAEKYEQSQTSVSVKKVNTMI